MRIGIDISQAVSPRDGIGNYASQLTRALMATSSPHDFSLHALSRPLGADEVKRQFPRMPPNFRLQLDSNQLDSTLDIFHSPSWVYPQGAIGRVVTTCHDVTFLSHPEFHVPSNKARCTKGMLEALLDDAHFLCVSQHTRAELGRRLGVPAQRTSVIYEGAGDVFRPRDRRRARLRLRRTLGIEGDYLLTIGRLEPRKNLVRLLHAYDGLPEDLRARTSLLFAGPEGGRNEDMHSYLAERHSAGTVKLLGFVAEDTQADLYAAAAAFVYPSLAEGFGLPVLEALACGAAVATSGSTALPEVAGDAALYFDPTDTDDMRSVLERLLTDEAEAERLRTKALERATRFTWKKAARETLELYERLGSGTP